MWERTGGKNLPPWTRVPSVATVQQRAKEQQRQRQPFHTSGISQDSLNRTPPGFVLRQRRGRSEREGGERSRRKEKNNGKNLGELVYIIESSKETLFLRFNFFFFSLSKIKSIIQRLLLFPHPFVAEFVLIVRTGSCFS